MIALKLHVAQLEIHTYPKAIEIPAESVIASLELARYQIAQGREWSASEILDEVIRELRGQPHLLQ